MSIGRKTTAKERRKWLDFKDKVKALSLEVSANRLTLANLHTVERFAEEHKIDILTVSDADKKLDMIIKAAKRLEKWIRLVDDGILGIRFKDGDFDIMAPQGTTDDQLVEYQSFSGWPFVIAIGVIVFVSAVFYTMMIRDENDKLRKDFNRVIYDAESRFCAVPGSPACEAWLQKREDSGYNENLSLMDEIKLQLKTIGKGAAKGAGILLLVGIPALILYLTTRKKEK